MTLTTYEQKLQDIDPRFRIKRVAAGFVGIHHNGKFVCRISSREITLKDVVRKEYAQMADMESLLNPLGDYSWERLLQRGRWNTAQMLYSQKLIKHSDIPKLTY